MWMRGLATKEQAELWLQAVIVPLFKEIKNADRTTKTKPRVIALLATPMKLIESIAVDQVAYHLIALMQTRQVGFRVPGGGYRMIEAGGKENY